MLLGEGFESGEFTLDKAAFFQEPVQFLRGCGESGGPDAVSRKHLCIGLQGYEVAGAGIQPAAAKGAEGDHFLSGKIDRIH